MTQLQLEPAGTRYALPREVRIWWDDWLSSSPRKISEPRSIPTSRLVSILSSTY